MKMMMIIIIIKYYDGVEGDDIIFGLLMCPHQRKYVAGWKKLCVHVVLSNSDRKLCAGMVVRAGQSGQVCVIHYILTSLNA